MKTVTVILPVYNGAEFLAEMMDSVLGQTYSEFDFLIINDASTDNSEEVILSYKDPRIKYLVNEKNLGSIGTPLRAMDMCETEYIARIDQDDIWKPTKLEKQIAIMDARPQVGLCGTSIELFGDKEGVRMFPVSNEELKAGFLFGCCMSHPSVIFRKSFLVNSGLRYNPDYRLADDYKMWIDCLEHTQIYNIPEVLVKYRQHESQICSPLNAEKQLVVKNRVRLEMLERINKNFTQVEKDFHINSFVDSKIESVSDYKQFVTWSEVLLQKNKDGGSYIQPDILKKELFAFVQISYKIYLIKKYFDELNLKSLLRYLFSFEWKNLSLKRNVRLIIKCINLK